MLGVKNCLTSGMAWYELEPMVVSLFLNLPLYWFGTKCD